MIVRVTENDWTIDNLTKNTRLLSVTIDGSKRTNDITSLHSQYHYGLTDRRPKTSRLN